MRKRINFQTVATLANRDFPLRELSPPSSPKIGAGGDRDEQ
jgi:hypothetical protein